MSNEISKRVEYSTRITKDYIINLLNSLMFSQTVLWDGVDQFNELPIITSNIEEGYRLEQRGAFFVDNRYSRVLRMMVTVSEDSPGEEHSSCRVCYRITGLPESIRIGTRNQTYYPFTVPIDFSIADLRLGVKTPFLTFADNTDQNTKVNNNKLMALVAHLVSSSLITVYDEELFHDLTNDILSTPPTASDPHFNLVFGVSGVGDSAFI